MLDVSTKVQTNHKFLSDVTEGLEKTPKRISSRWFYDAKGDELFQQIMQLPEYYLTRAEYAILEKNAGQILSNLSNEKSLLLVELGAGDGLKTRLLLNELSNSKRPFKYAPVDISQNALDKLTKQLSKEFPQLPIIPLQADYFDALKSNVLDDKSQKMVLFLGSNIGNLNEKESVLFYSKLNDVLNPGDAVLTGFDRVKNPETILAAYNDKAGVTREFNLNLLKRINRELGADFDLNYWSHLPQYSTEKKSALSYLVSEIDQEVSVALAGKSFQFKRGERIHTEMSRKFTLHDIETLASESGFTVSANFHSEGDAFTNSLWTK